MYNDDLNYNDESDYLCYTCGASIESVHNIIMVLYSDDSNVPHYLQMSQLIDILNSWIDNNLIHLSATELILLRTEIVAQILKEHFELQKDVPWGFCSLPVCDKCYNEYIKKFPLK